jgi:hypothetical protein
MKNIVIVVALAALLGCGAPGSLDHDTAASDKASAVETEVEELEEEDEELEIPPAGSKPLSEIIASVEVPGHLQVFEVEFEDGVWEIEYVMDGEEHELQIDPITGEAVDDEDEETD